MTIKNLKVVALSSGYGEKQAHQGCFAPQFFALQILNFLSNFFFNSSETNFRTKH